MSIKTLRSKKLNELAIYRFLIISVLIFFLIRSIELAITMSLGISPDETYHYGVSQLYSKVPFLVNNDPSTIQYGLIGDTPYLYHLLMGNLIKISRGWIDTLVILRLANVLISFLTVIYSFKLTCFLTKSKLARILSLILITNIPMFTFLSSSVSYDNLTNLLMTVAIYQFLVFYKTLKVQPLLVTLIILQLSLLTKITTIPIVFMLIIFIIWIVLKAHPKTFIKQISFRKINPKLLVSLILLSFTTFFVALFYGQNLINYNKLLPTCTQVYSIDVCRQNKIFARDEIQINGKPDDEIIDPFHFAEPWSEMMISRIFGIYGHKTLLKSPEDLVAYEVLLILGILGIFRLFSKKNHSINFLLILSGFYILILIYYQNYQSYLATARIYAALQGRYLFPILAPLVSIYAITISKLFVNRFVKILLVIVISILFVWGDYVYFKKNVPQDWFKKNEPVLEINDV